MNERVKHRWPGWLLPLILLGVGLPTALDAARPKVVCGPAYAKHYS